jgi:5-methylcytosine-specific restriction endonuclease McrA
MSLLEDPTLALRQIASDAPSARRLDAGVVGIEARGPPPNSRQWERHQFEREREVDMVKKRTSIPRDTRDGVLREFNHQCAVCRAPHPHIHHIDGDPGNHSPDNLLPLCPNCHLVDNHNPTQRPDARKLKLFRIHKDPSILSAEFEPLFRRFTFLYAVESSAELDGASEAVDELIAFVGSFQMGDFYAKRLATLLKYRAWEVFSIGEPESVARQRARERRERHRAQLISGRDEAIALVVELMRYQPWRPGAA